MTLESTLCVERFVGNGTTKSFSFTFRVWETDQIAVYRKTDDHREADCTGEFTVELNDAGVSGGVVTFLTAPSSGQVIAICRSMPFIQEDVYLNGSRFDASEVEDRFDQDCAERQQLKFGVSRAVKVPWTDDRTVEGYTQDFWDAVDQTQANMETSRDCADRSCSCADKACACADDAEESAQRAESAGILGSHVENIDATWELTSDVSSGTVITLPYYYYPKRNVLYLSYDGVDMYLGQQYEEVGDSAETMSNQVTVLCNLSSGTVMHMWVVMSNVAKYADETIQRMEDACSKLEAEVDGAIARADACAGRSCECADVSCECANRAESACTLGTLSENLEAVWTLDADVSSGTAMTLPFWYYPARRMLHLSYDGVEMYPGSQYEEGGTGQDVLVNTVTVLCSLASGTEMHAWAVMSNVARYAEQVQEELEQGLEKAEDYLAQLAEEACACRDESCACAQEAKKSQEQAANSAAEATEQADRADDAAVDAANAAEAATKAAACAYRYRGGRILGAVADEALLGEVPNGFYVVNPSIVVPATPLYSLIPLPNEDALPDDCDGFFVIGPAFIADPCPDSWSGGGGSGSGNPSRGDVALMPCGKRSHYSTE